MQPLLRTIYAWLRRLGASRRLSGVLGVTLALAIVAVPMVVFANEPEVQSPDPVDNLMIWAAGLIMGVVQFIGKLVLLVTDLAIVVMQYNGFADSQVISAGWRIVRNVVNMFFIVLLLVIAIVTIFGGKVGSWQVDWTKDVLRVLGAAVLINFSRTICIVLIDISQVFMLTFANAIRDVAGGNFIQLFGMADILAIDRTRAEELATTGAGIQAFDMLAGALLALLLMSIILGTMVMLFGILLYRIVILWILVVLSPLAFFMNAVPGSTLAKGRVNPYGEWWNTFVGAAASGPILVFFVWLALSVASAGSIASAEAFPVAAGAADVNTGGFINTIATSGRMMSFAIGIGMMFVGFQAANKLAGAVPGIGGIVGRGVKGALGVTTAGAGAALGAAAFAGRLGLKGGGLAYRQAARSRVGQRIAAGRNAALRGAGSYLAGSSLARRVPLLGSVVGGVGAGIAGVGASLEDRRRAQEAERVKDQQSKVDNLTVDEMRDQLRNGAVTPQGLAKQQAMRLRILTNKKLRSDLSNEDLSSLYADFQKFGGDDVVLGDSGLTEKMTAFKRERVDLLDTDEKAKVLSRMSSEELMKVDAEALRDQAVRDELAGREEWDRGANGGKGGYVSLLERMESGRRGNSKQKKVLDEIKEGKLVDADKITDDAAAALSADKQTTRTLSDLAAAGRTDANPLGKMKGLVESGNIQVGNMDVSLFDDPDFMSAFLRAMPNDQVRQLGEHSDAGAIAQKMQQALATDSYLTGNDRENARRKRDMNTALVEMGMSGGSMRTMGYGASGFEGPDKVSGYRAAVGRSPELLVGLKSQLKAQNAAGYGGNRELADNASAHANVSKLVGAYRRGSVDDKDELIDVMEEITTGINRIVDEDARNVVDLEGIKDATGRDFSGDAKSLHDMIDELQQEADAKQGELDASTGANKALAKQELNKIKNEVSELKGLRKKMDTNLKQIRKIIQSDSDT